MSLKGEIMKENEHYKILYQKNYVGRVLFLILHKPTNKILSLFRSSGLSGTGHKGEILPFMFLNERVSIRGEVLGYIFKQMLYKGYYLEHYKEITKDIIQFLNPIKEFVQDFRDERTIEELNHFMDKEFTIEYVKEINTELRDIIKEYKLFDYYEDLNKIREEKL
jgi:hypothetical protein